MNILNKDKTDFSAEVLVQLAIMLECVYAAELIAYKVAVRLTAMVTWARSSSVASSA